MTPREFLRRYKFDKRLVNGAYYPAGPIDIEPGDKVGVVLMNLGGPNRIEDVEPFLYNLFMDPAIIDIPLKGVLRHWACKLIASRRSKSVGKDYEEIGGGSPINRLTREQARAVERQLNKEYGRQDVTFRVFIAMRYWHPTSEETAARMQVEGINKVILLPLYPHFSKTTTGSSLLYWRMLEDRGEIPSWPTTQVVEYAAYPKYVQAVSERIDEGLQRFPKAIRDNVHLVFSAHGTPLKEMTERRDPYCCLVHSTVDRVMKHRASDRPFHVAFQSKVGPAEWLTPSTPDKLKELAEAGHKSVLIIPIAFVTDHIETAFELDIEIREEAKEFGIQHYEVTNGLNCHPLFIEALADVVAAQLRFDVEAGAMGDGSSGEAVLDGAPRRVGRLSPSERTCRCHQCGKVTEAVKWECQPKGTGVSNVA